MFFRRQVPKIPTFAERLDGLQQAGFTIRALPGGVTRVERNPCGVELSAEGRLLRPAGILMGNEIGALVDAGFQKFFQTPSGKRKPGLAEELKALHDFEEDLREGLGEESYYNQSLGTVSTFYLYDRLKDRDRGAPKRIWEA
jgi:hypothetical protein